MSLWQRGAAIVSVGFFLSLSAPAWGVVLAEFDFEQPASGDTPVPNLGIGPDGRLLEDAVVADGVLNIAGLGQGLEIPFDALNPFAGTADWSVQFDFASEDEGGGPLFSSDASDCPDECNDAVAAGSLNIFLTGEGEVVVDAWFIGAIGTETGLNDGEIHNIRLDYTAEEGLWELYLDGDEEPADDAVWPYERDSTLDRTQIGNQTNPDFGFEDIDPDEDGIVATIDNFVIDAPSPPPVIATVDRDTGEISIRGIQEGGINFNALTISSSSGSLDVENWTPIAGNYDAAGDGSVDANDNWTASEDASSEMLAESQEGGDGANLDLEQEFSVGAGVWLASPLEDVRVEIFDVGLGETVRGAVAYTGEEDLFGDLNSDGELDGTDWELFVDGFGQPLEGLTGRDRYFLADLTGDGLHDAEDFIEFSIAYDEANGEGALAALIPEPSSWVLLVMGGLGLLRRRRPDHAASSVRQATSARATYRRAPPTVGLGMGVLALLLASTLPLRAELLVEYLFDDDTSDTSGNNRDGILDEGIFGDGMPDVINGRLSLTGEVGEGMEIPLGDSNPFDGSGDFTIDVTFNVAINDDETGYLILSSADEAEPSLGDNHSMSIFLDGEGSIVYDNFFVGEVRVEGQDYRDEEDHQLRIAYTAPAEEDEPGQMFIRVDGDWLGAGEIQPEVPEISDDVVYLGTSLNEEFPFECEEVCAVKDLEGTLDDVRIYNESFAPSQMKAQVDRATGDVSLLGGEFVRDIRYYEVSSESGSLNESAWEEASFDTQEVDAIGEGIGESWDVLTASESRAVEAFLQGSSEFADERAVVIAKAWGGDEDVAVQIVTTDDEILLLPVEYINEGMGHIGPSLDCNGDGVVDAKDFDCSNMAGTTDELIAELGLVKGDLDGNGEVAFADFQVLSTNFSLEAPYSGGDIDGNGTVGFADFQVLSTNFGKTGGGPAAASVPEPMGLLMLCWGAVSCGMMRRRHRGLR